MKRLIISSAFLFAAAGFCFAADGHITVNSEKIFKSLPEYNSALKQVENYSKARQAEVDAKYAEVEAKFEDYAKRRSQLTPERAAQQESQILAAENDAKKLQEAYFGQDGSVMRYRIETIKPIQEKVFSVIENYAKSQGAATVLDEASNASILYSGNEAKHTQAIIEKLK